MQKKRFPTLVITLALAGLAADALGMGFGAVSSSATLGQGLDHVIGLRLDPGESLTPDCVNADVMIGEQRVPAAAVRTRLEGDAANPVLRVQTLGVVDEPVVSVSVSLGCPVRLSRRFTLFADPAPILAPSAPVATPVDALPAAAPAAPPAVVAAAPEPKASAAAPRPRRNTGTSTAAPRAARAPRPAVRNPQTAPAAPAAPAVAAARPRLKLDVAEPPPAPQPAITAEVIEAAASAAAAQAAALAASAAAARITALEQSIEKLRADSQADRDALRLLRQKAAEVDAVSAWMPWLAALSAGLAALALWLAYKLRRLQRERQQVWWQAGAAAAADKASAPPSEARAEPTTTAEASLGAGPSTGGYSTTRPGTLGPVFATDLPSVSTLNEAPLGVGEQTQALPVGWRDDEPARDVSIEELIDLEQQAEFFIVLGQEEAAVDLLVDHLRSTGGGSPMPYLKLLEIYRKRGDRESYDRMRARFNHRFNAYAPDWDTDATDGRSLEDYPAIVARLQMAWPSPIDAMAELESLLFRKARGELFDMPAYRDVLFLYSLARDLLDREPVDSGNVDVLLPINDGADFTQPMSLDELPPVYDSGLVPLDGSPTVPVDLDVTQPAVPESLFGETATEPGPTGGGRRRR